MVEMLAFGFGYSVEPLARMLLEKGWSVRGTTRSEEKAANLQENGVTPILWSGNQPIDDSLVAGAKVLIVSVPPDEHGCPVARSTTDLPADTICLYLSSSGVYGDHEGAWVDEDTICVPTSERGKRRLQAESQWQSLAEASGARLHLCRLAGIYGPGRNALLSLSGETRGKKAGLAQRIIKPGQVFNRIHRDDIAAGLMALIKAGTAPQILNFSDDEPSPPQDVLTFAAELLGIEPPAEIAFEKAELSDMARSFYRDNKRLRNERLKSLPDFQLKYPSYREGLRSLLAGI